MMKSTILVAGGTGNLGERIIKALIKRGAEVRAIVRNGSEPEKIAKLTNIKAGGSASDLNETNDDRVSVYTFRDGKLFLAGNLDKERNSEKPSLDEYSKVTK